MPNREQKNLLRDFLFRFNFGVDAGNFRLILFNLDIDQSNALALVLNLGVGRFFVDRRRLEAIRDKLSKITRALLFPLPWSNSSRSFSFDRLSREFWSLRYGGIFSVAVCTFAFQTFRP